MKEKGHAWRIGLILLFLVSLPFSANAENPAPADRWTFAVQPYLWLPSISGSLSYSIPEGGGGPDVDIDTTKILEDLNFALMFTAEARKSRWSLVTDVIYLDLESSGSQVKSVNFSGPGGRVTVPATLDTGTSVEIKGVEWGLAGAYTVAQGKTSSLDVLLGFRYFGIEAKTDWNLSGTVSGPGPGQSFARSGSITERENLWDGIIGIRGRVGLGSGKWGIPYYFDVGTGSSDLTWQGGAGIQYRFSWIDLSLMYRYLYYDMESGKLLQDVGLGGPAFGVNFRF
ncbi:MAG TPA: hypothetical protein DEH27_01750 [Deltaproteobacteria bacterium]|nr:hypothetical protein [Deltaproteobacteria bacterium]